VVKVDETEYTPALRNDPALTRRVVGVLRGVLGEEKVTARPAVMGGEDFSRYGIHGKMPIFLFWLGTVAPERVAAAAKEGGKPLPSLHSDRYYPVPAPSLETGVLAMSMAVLDLLGK
jgi:hippurate hydrolase